MVLSDEDSDEELLVCENVVMFTGIPDPGHLGGNFTMSQDIKGRLRSFEEDIRTEPKHKRKRTRHSAKLTLTTPSLQSTSNTSSKAFARSKVTNDSDSDGPPEETAVLKKADLSMNNVTEELAMQSSKDNQDKNVKPDKETLLRQFHMSEKRLDEIKEAMKKKALFKVLRQRQNMAPKPKTLLENLLAKDIERERVQLLQCVKFVCERSFFGAK